MAVIFPLDSQGSADTSHTSRSQHTDVTSELSSVVSVPDRTGKYQFREIHNLIKYSRGT